ncbi:MAG: hypothetical protein ACOC9P_00285 [bacterium]
MKCFALVVMIMLGSNLTATDAMGKDYHVHPTAGRNEHDGSADRPWRTINHALEQLQPGDTLLLHGERYHEQVTCSIWGEKDKPIVIRGAGDGEAVIDGGWRAFYESPEKMWEPVPAEAGGVEGEYRTTRPFRNISDAAGAFPDRPIRLNTYWRIADLRSDNEFGGFDGTTNGKPVLLKNVYAGPGLWYDRETGYIHARFAHTTLDHGMVTPYTGETDPRKIPLSITGFRTIPLTIDSARHVHFENVTVTGGGQINVFINESQNVTLDRVHVRAGCLEGQKSGYIKLTHCLLEGGLPPWVWRIDASGGSAAAAARDIIRTSPLKVVLQTGNVFQSHNLPRNILNDWKEGRPIGRAELVADEKDAQRPQMQKMLHNHDWEIANCEIKRGHDGVFLAGRNMEMHHCAIDDVQDDAFDPGSPVPYMTDGIYFHHNLIRRCVSAVSLHSFPRKDGWVYVYRNVFDLRQPVAWTRPEAPDAEPAIRHANGLQYHGQKQADSVESLYFAHNTAVLHVDMRYDFAASWPNSQMAEAQRRVFNNLFIYLGDYPQPYVSRSLEGLDFEMDGNLHWSPDEKASSEYLKDYREHEFSGDRWEKHALIADPKLRAFGTSLEAVNDYRPTPDSPAVGAAVDLTDDASDVLRENRSETIGAFEPGDEPLRVGVDGRITAGEPPMK